MLLLCHCCCVYHYCYENVITVLNARPSCYCLVELACVERQAGREATTGSQHQMG